MKSIEKTDESGVTYWMTEDGVYHREDGPAIVKKDGEKYWYFNNYRHRLDGPAVDYGDGDKAWYYLGKYIMETTGDVTEEQLKEFLAKII